MIRRLRLAGNPICLLVPSLAVVIWAGSDLACRAQTVGNQLSEAQIEELRASLARASAPAKRVRILVELAEGSPGDTAEVLELTEKAIGWLAGLDEPGLEARVRVCRSDALRSSAQHLTALTEARRAETLAREIGNDLLRARALYMRSAAEWRNSNTEAAQASATEALKLLERTNSPAELAKTHTLLGVIHRMRAEFESAISHHLQARRISERLRDESGIARSDNNLALIYWNLERLEDAHESMLRALRVYRKRNSAGRLRTCLSNLGLILIELERPAEAVPYLEEALAGSSGDGEPYLHAKLLSNYAFAQEKLGRQTEALEYYEKCLAVRRQIGDKQGIVRTTGALAALYQSRQQHEHAIPMLEEALALAEEIQIRSEQAALLELLSESRSAVGDHSAALDDYRRFHDLQIELSGPEVQQRIARLERRHAAERHASEKRELELVAEIRARQLASQGEAHRRLIITSIALGVGLALLAGLLYSRSRALAERRRVEAALLVSEQRLRSLAHELSMAEEEARRHVVSVLHDELSPTLATCQIQLSAMQRDDGGVGCDELREVSSKLEACSDQARSLAVEVCPPALYILGLVPALEWLVERFGEQHSIECVFATDCPSTSVDGDMLGPMYHSTRELLANIARHAFAKRVEINVSQAANGVVVEVKDDGVGFDPADNSLQSVKSRGYGLFGMENRFRVLGGQVDIESSPGFGSTIRIHSQRPTL